MDTSDGTDSSNTLGGTAQAKVQDLNQRAHHAVDTAAERASRAVEGVTGFPQRMENLAADCVKAHPFRSVAMGVAAGLLFGKLMR